MTVFLKCFFRQKSLVLRLQVDAPLDRIFEFFAGLQENVDRVGIGNSQEVSFQYAFGSVNTSLSMRSWKNFMSSSHFASASPMIRLMNASASVMLSLRS